MSLAEILKRFYAGSYHVYDYEIKLKKKNRRDHKVLKFAGIPSGFFCRKYEEKTTKARSKIFYPKVANHHMRDLKKTIHYSNVIEYFTRSGRLVSINLFKPRIAFSRQNLLLNRYFYKEGQLYYGHSTIISFFFSYRSYLGHTISTLPRILFC